MGVVARSGGEPTRYARIAKRARARIAVGAACNVEAECARIGGPQLDAVEYLLRDGASAGWVGRATAFVPIISRRSIDPNKLGAGANGDIELDLTETMIEIDAEVEVRSRFHDGWVHGFTVADYVRGRDGVGYRLRRLAEADPLPMLYDPGDVRRAILTNEPPPPVPRSSFADG